jgi:hypothetical protein
LQQLERNHAAVYPRESFDINNSKEAHNSTRQTLKDEQAGFQADK